MTEPHTHSDDMAIAAAQARVWDNLVIRATAMFARAASRPTTSNIKAVASTLLSLHHQWVARMEENRDEPGDTANPAPLTQHISNPGRYLAFGRKPRDPAAEEGDMA